MLGVVRRRARARRGVRTPSTRAGWLCIVYLAVVGSVVTFLLYFWLLRHWDATRCGLISVLTPILAVALGSIVRDEPVTAHLVAGSALVLTGVFLAMRPGAPLLRLAAREQQRVEEELEGGVGLGAVLPRAIPTKPRAPCRS